MRHALLVRRGEVSAYRDAGIRVGAAVAGSSMSMVLFCDDGDEWGSRIAQLKRRLETRETDEAFVDFAIRNIGYIQVSHLATGRAVVKLRGKTASPLALSNTIYWMYDHGPNRIMGEVFDEATQRYHLRVLGDKVTAKQRLWAMCAKADSSGPWQVARAPRSLDALAPDSPLRVAIGFWQEKARTFSLEPVRSLLAREIGGRYMILRLDRPTDELVIVEVGDGLPEFARNSLARCVGLRAQDQPDYDYGRSCAQAYREALARGEPVLEDVDAVVAWPGFGRMRRRYKRLMLPFTAGNGDRWLLTTTVQDPSIELLREIF